MGQLNTTLEFYGSCDITACFMLWGQGGLGAAGTISGALKEKSQFLSGNVQNALYSGQQKDADVGGYNVWTVFLYLESNSLNCLCILKRKLDHPVLQTPNHLATVQR